MKADFRKIDAFDSDTVKHTANANPVELFIRKAVRELLISLKSTITVSRKLIHLPETPWAVAYPNSSQSNVLGTLSSSRLEVKL